MRLTAHLIEITEAMGFPPFSGDGRYLEVHDVDQMERLLGSREDDSLNAFTARMLLLLESKPVYGSERYDQILRRVVGFYYRDFEGHEHDFVPVFLTNDILRFWRTLTLNYEHDRYKISALEGEQREHAKAKSALKNYKLKCSRLLTCYSMVLHLASAPPPVTVDAVVGWCLQTPRERLASLARRSTDADRLLAEIADRYSLFLKNVQRPEDELLAEFGSADVRRERLTAAAELGQLIFDLLVALTDRDRLRHLVV